MHTPQSLFTTVARHLLTQMEVSRLPVDFPGITGTNGCAYRGEEGRRCAIGCLIPDDHYLEAMEGVGIDWPSPEARALRDILEIPHIGPVFALAGRLQALHDNQHPREWRSCLARVAADFGLAMPEAP